MVATGHHEVSSTHPSPFPIPHSRLSNWDSMAHVPGTYTKEERHRNEHKWEAQIKLVSRQDLNLTSPSLLLPCSSNISSPLVVVGGTVLPAAMLAPSVCKCNPLLLLFSPSWCLSPPPPFSTLLPIHASAHLPLCLPSSPTRPALIHTSPILCLTPSNNASPSFLTHPGGLYRYTHMPTTASYTLAQDDY